MMKKEASVSVNLVLTLAPETGFEPAIATTLFQAPFSLAYIC